MTVTAERTVRDLVVENPAATRVFERLHIDYCCGGNRTLEDACRAAGVPLDQVLVWLDAAVPAPASDRDWQTAPLADLVAHIRDTHHVYTREALARISQLLEKVCSVHGANHPELHGIRTTFAGLAQELTTHLMKEEMVLFPYIVRMEEAVVAGEPIMPPPFGTVRNPVAMMMREHDGAGDALQQIRRSSNDYTAPADGCITYQTLYRALAELEADLHQHIHLENNILFPRALNMEQ
jgi:regulator of cell morphogenesis and NO signaling